MAGGRRRRKGWIVAVVLAGMFGILNALGAVVRLLRGDWLEALLGAGFARASYWFSYGAWLRTPWAERAEVDPVPAPTGVTDTQLRRYLLAAGLAAIAVALALGLQAVSGEWVN